MAHAEIPDDPEAARRAYESGAFIEPAPDSAEYERELAEERDAIVGEAANDDADHVERFDGGEIRVLVDEHDEGYVVVQITPREGHNFEPDVLALVRSQHPDVEGSETVADYTLVALRRPLAKRDDAVRFGRQLLRHARPWEPKLVAAQPAKAASPPGPTVWTPASVVADIWRKEGPLVHEPTGIAILDQNTGGGPVYGSRVYVVGAPDAAKTGLVVQVMDTYARRGIMCGLLAIDEEPSDIVTRLAQRVGYRRVECEERTEETCDGITERLADLPIRMYGPEHTIESAMADLDAAARKAAVRAAFFLDSIQACRSVASDGAETTRDLVSSNVAALRAGATRYRMIAMATSEMNRNAYRSIESAESSNDMAAGKESGAIEFSARVMLALRSVKAEPDLVEVHIVKNKHGPGGVRFHLRIDRRRMILEETEAPPVVDMTAAKDAAARERVVVDAALAAEAIVAQPGIGVRELYAALRASRGSFGHSRADAAVARLGGAVVRLPGSRGAMRLHIDGSLVGAEILSAIPLDKRPAIAASRQPSITEPTVPPSSDRPGTVPGDAPSECPTVSRGTPMGGRGTGRSICEAEDTPPSVPDEAPRGTVEPDDEAAS